MRTNIKPKLWQDCMADSEWSALKQTCETLHLLTDWVNAYVSAPLQNQFKVVRYQQAVLKLALPSSLILMRFNYEKTHLLSELRRHHLPELSSIECRIDPRLASLIAIKTALNESAQNAPQKPTKTATLPAQSAQLLKNVAESIQDQKLKEAILNLARLGKE